MSNNDEKLKKMFNVDFTSDNIEPKNVYNTEIIDDSSISEDCSTSNNFNKLLNRSKDKSNNYLDNPTDITTEYSDNINLFDDISNISKLFFNKIFIASKYSANIMSIIFVYIYNFITKITKHVSINLFNLIKLIIKSFIYNYTKKNKTHIHHNTKKNIISDKFNIKRKIPKNNNINISPLKTISKNNIFIKKNIKNNKKHINNTTSSSSTSSSSSSTSTSNTTSSLNTFNTEINEIFDLLK